MDLLSLNVHILFENIDFEMSIQRPYCPYRVHISNVEPYIYIFFGGPLLKLFGTFNFFLIFFFKFFDLILLFLFF